MSVRNNHWYGLNELRSYPLDDTASCVSTNNELLPSTIIQDLRLRWPEALGEYAFISAVSVTTGIVTVLIEVTNNSDGSDSRLLAGITIPRDEVLPGQTFRLQAFENYVGGFICFGNFTGLLFSGFFSGPAAGLLAARAARPARTPPVSSIRVENSATALTGVINLTSVEPLTIKKATKTINGIEYENVLVFSLTQEPADIPAETNLDLADPVLLSFSGDCGKRFSSKTCGDPKPIENINGVYPDCDGNINIEITGCATVGRNVENCGMIVDCSLGLSSSCEPPYLPRLSDGVLPLEAPPILKSPTLPPEPPVIEDTEITDTITTVIALPYCDNFDFASSTWGIAEGFGFSLVADDSPGEAACCDNSSGNIGCSESASVSFSESYSEQLITGNRYQKVPIDDSIISSFGPVIANAETRKNIAIFSEDVQTLFRKYTTDFKIITPTGTGNRKGGILINYQQDPTTGVFVYYHLELNIEEGRFSIKYFNGIQDITIAYAEIIDLRTNDWYRLSFSAVPSPALTQINFTAELQGISDPTIAVTINAAVGSRNWLTDSGVAGLITNRTKGYFSFWRIDEVE